MKNYGYLTPEEQHLFSQISGYKGIFTSKDILNLTGKSKNRNLMNLNKKGYILRLKRGFYVTKDYLSENPYKIAAELEKVVIGFISALKLHDLIDYEPNKIIVITGSNSYKLDILNYSIEYINLKQKWGIEELNDIFITDIEKTILDSIFMPELSGGYPVIAKAIYDSEIDWKRLISYLEKYNKSSLYQKLGYMLSLLKKKHKKIPEYILKTAKKNIKNKLRLTSNSKLKYKYIKDWKIMDNLGEKHILGGIDGA